MHARGEEGMLESIHRSDPLFGVKGEAGLQQVMKQVELLQLHLTHPARRGQQTRTKIPGRLDKGQDLHDRLQ